MSNITTVPLSDMYRQIAAEVSARLNPLSWDDLLPGTARPDLSVRRGPGRPASARQPKRGHADEVKRRGGRHQK